jgi:tetratricopeptide (TPR) repeat protein
VAIVAGETAKLRVRVRRSDTSKPVQLEFHGLPSGITAESSTIPAGADMADVSLRASTATPVGTTEISVAFAAGPERGEAGTRVKVLPRTQGTVAYERGCSNLARGEYAKAVSDFTEAIWLGADWFEALLHRGVAYNLEGRLEEALADYDEAIRLQPNNADAYLVRAKAHCDLGENRLGLQDYSAAIRLRGDAKAYLARGRLHHEMGAYDRAVADFEAALRLRSDDTAARFHLGLTRYVMGDNANAIQDFTEVIRLDPQDASAYRLRGDAFARLGDYAHAGADHQAFERLRHPSGARVLK